MTRNDGNRHGARVGRADGGNVRVGCPRRWRIGCCVANRTQRHKCTSAWTGTASARRRLCGENVLRSMIFQDVPGQSVMCFHALENGRSGLGAGLFFLHLHFMHFLVNFVVQRRCFHQGACVVIGIAVVVVQIALQRNSG